METTQIYKRLIMVFIIITTTLGIISVMLSQGYSNGVNNIKILQTQYNTSKIIGDEALNNLKTLQIKYDTLNTMNEETISYTKVSLIYMKEIAPLVKAAEKANLTSTFTECKNGVDKYRQLAVMTKEFGMETNQYYNKLATYRNNTRCTQSINELKEKSAANTHRAYQYIEDLDNYCIGFYNNPNDNNWEEIYLAPLRISSNDLDTGYELYEHATYEAYNNCNQNQI